jgi:soluble lytic murein transglycosylase-like protein
VVRRSVVAGLATALVLTGEAPARVAHTVQPGETLWSIAAASNFTTRALAAANGLGENAAVVAGQTIHVPSVPEAAAALEGAGVSAPRPQGAYTVRRGDTLSGIAARSGISTSQLAWMNGLSPTAYVLEGMPLKLPTGAPPAQAQAQVQPAPPAPEPAVVPAAAPQASPGRVTPTEIGQVAVAHGVPAPLATAVAWQESGFNNGVVSAANARGVMQVLPGTWHWVETSLAHRRLDATSPLDNVHAGVMYLGQLLRDADGDVATAVASYYQGASSVRRSGMFRDTRRYVDNVTALRSRFGG